jgi:flagellar basal body-associated protein FliL
MSSPKDPKKEETAGEAEAAPAKKPRILPIALAAAACCGAAGAASYMLIPASVFAPTSAANGEAAAMKSDDKQHTEKKEADKKHGAEKSAKKDGHDKNDGDKKTEDAGETGATAFFVRGSTGVFTPRPIVVSLKPQGRIRYLKVILAVETTPESEHAFMEGELRIIDILTSYLRAVPVTALEDPAAMARIREQIARRIAFIVDPAPVNAVLITDFILS